MVQTFVSCNNVIGNGQTGLISVKYSIETKNGKFYPGTTCELRKHSQPLLMIFEGSVQSLLRKRIW